MAEVARDHRRATAERNVEAILDAVAALLERGAGGEGAAAAAVDAVAAEAGVSRVTVYSHFPTREALLEAEVERVVGRASAAVAEAELESGTAAEALDRLVAAGWREIERHRTIAQAASEVLSPAAMIRAHRSLHEPIVALIRRGQADGSFRDDLPADWLLATYFALMHACGDEVRGGRLPAGDAVAVLQRTVRGVFAPPPHC